MLIDVQISIGEFFDKLTILEIKSQKISDFEKLKMVNREIKMLKQGRKILIDNLDVDIYKELKFVNTLLWNSEDEIRRFESNSIFDKSFIDVARSIYKLNDRRFHLKNKINILLGSSLREIKNH